MARPGLLRHRKFARLSRLLGSRALALGHLEMLWGVAYEAGDAFLGDAGDLEQLGEWQGEPGALAAAMVEAGFVDQVEGGYEVHDLWDHAPDYVRKRRTREAQRRTKGAELSSVTGQSPVSDRSVTAEREDSRSHTLSLETPPTPSPAPGGAADSQPGQEPEPPQPPRRFVHPTVEQVAEHIAKKGYHFSPQAFIAHYTANGWRVGKNPMRDWRAACVTWETRWLEEHGQRPRKRGDVPPDGRVIPDGFCGAFAPKTTEELAAHYAACDAQTEFVPAPIFRRQPTPEPT